MEGQVTVVGGGPDDKVGRCYRQACGAEEAGVTSKGGT